MPELSGQAPGRAEGFRRELGRFDATMVVVGAIIGAGIFINPYIVAARLNTAVLVLAAWVAGGAIALVGSLAYAELGALYPRAGGQYAYLRDAYHPLFGFLYGWGLLLVIETGAMAAVAMTFAQYALRLVGRPDTQAPLIAVLAILLLSFVNYLGVKPGSRLLNVFVLLKVAALAVLIGAGLLMQAGSSGTGPSGAVLPGAGSGPIAFGAALVPILFAYGGWQNLNYVAEEMRHPSRDMPVSLVLGTSIVVIVYLLVNVVYLRLLGHASLAHTLTPASDAAARVLGSGGDRFVAAAIAVSTFGFLDLAILAPTRVYYAMAADGLFLPAVARLHPRFRTPSVAIVIQSAWAVLLALTGSYAQLLDYVVFADWIFFGLSVGSLFVFRRRVPLAERDARAFRTPGYPVLPALFVVIAAGVVFSAIWSSPRQSGIGALLLAAGIPVFFWYRRRPAGTLPAARGTP